MARKDERQAAVAGRYDAHDRDDSARSAYEAELRATLDSVADGVLAVDEHGKVLHANAPFAELWRIPAPLMLRGDDRALLDFVLEQLADPDAFLAKVQALYASDAVDEDTISFKDGRTFERRSLPMRADGVRIGRVWCFRDISARRQSDEELQRNLAILRSVTDGTTDAVFVKDTKGRYLMCNDATCRFVGKTRDEILGRDDTALFPLAEAQSVMARDRGIMEAGVTTTVEEFVTAGEKVRTFLATKGPVRDSAGRVIGLFGISRDVTEREQAEAALRKTQKALLRSQHATKIGSWTYDPVSQRIEWSEEVYAMYGLDPATPVTVTNTRGLVHPDDWERYDALVQLALSTASPFEIELRGMRPDGTSFHQTTWGEMEVGEDGTRTLVGTTQDTTDRKRAEEAKANLEAQLQQAQKMESVGRLAGGVAHDFNNMLGVILGHAELALSQLDAGQPLHGDLADIRDAALRSAELTRQLLAFARKQSVTPVVLGLNAAVSGTFSMLRRLIGEAVTLTWQPATALWPVLLDPSQLDQLLANLCVNARDAIGGVGTVVLATANRVLDATWCAAHAEAVPGEYVQLSVTDDGCGMPRAVLDHLFEPFFTTKKAGEGTGLGLATVYGVVKQNHGFVAVASEVGKGTTFDVFLPRYTGALAPATPADAAVPMPRGTETILLVEDEAAVRRVTARTLRAQGYTVVEAEGPEAAIRLATEHAGAIDLLLTDVMMPVMSGGDLAHTLLAAHPQLRHLFMSGYPASDGTGGELVMDDAHFLSKPFSRAALAVKVREVLDRD